MLINEDKDRDSTGLFGILFSDILIQYSMLILFFFLLVAALPHNQTPVVNPYDCKIQVELTWEPRNIDLDLWVMAPDDVVPVGYSNMHSKHFNLLRDVVGFNGNPSHTMLEMACSDDAPQGEYIINVFYFANHEDNPSDPAVNSRVTVAIGSQRFTGEYKMVKEGQEKTMFRFMLDSQGDIVDGSINSNDIFIKNGQKSLITSVPSSSTASPSTEVK